MMPSLRYCHRIWCAIVLFGALACPLYAAQDFNAYIRQINANINSLNNHSNNHESELRQMEEKFSNLDVIVDGLRQQLTDSSKTQTDQWRSSKGSMEEKLGELDLMSKGLAADFQILKNHLNESLQRLSVNENTLKTQGQNIDNLQAALKSMMEILQPSDEKDQAQNLYQVKSGDTLEKIAQTHGTTIKSIKELNNLTTDRIRVNQKLKISAK